VVVGLDLKWFVRRKRVDLGVIDAFDYPDGFAKKSRERLLGWGQFTAVEADVARFWDELVDTT
jgi:hypothetical protein